MEKITNTKLLPDGRFRPFPGFSLLFDNPGTESYTPLGNHVWLTDRQEDASSCPSFYAKLRACLGKTVLEKLNAGCRFFDLPIHSYHVTVWDGLNVANRKKVYWSCQPDLADFLLDLPGTLRATSKFTALPESSPLAGACDIAFRFAKLSVFGDNDVLVARLKPADDESQKAFDEIQEHRSKLYERFEAQFGALLSSSKRRDTYSPHVSLGYLGNNELGAAARSQLGRWTVEFAEALENETIRFRSISLYGFLDMVTFFKRT